MIVIMGWLQDQYPQKAESLNSTDEQESPTNGQEKVLKNNLPQERLEGLFIFRHLLFTPLNAAIDVKEFHSIKCMGANCSYTPAISNSSHDTASRAVSCQIK